MEAALNTKSAKQTPCILGSDAMSTTQAAMINVSQQALRFKGTMLPVTVMELFTADLVALEQHLASKLQDPSAFFTRSPLVLNAERLPPELMPDLAALVACCQRHELLPIAVRGGNHAWREQAWSLGLGWIDAQESARAQNKAAPHAGAGLIVERTIRSGQQVWSPKGDLVILGSVNEGAEVLAAGSIHVYGTLRGRALAGIHGDQKARIFCMQMDAELLAIAGNYKMAEDFASPLRGKPVQTYLEAERLLLAELQLPTSNGGWRSWLQA